jgi:hypothetical protein
MGTETTSVVVHPEGEQPKVEEKSAVADTYGGRVHVEWDATAPVTPFGQLPFFIEYLKQGGLFDGWVADCPLSLTSPNAPRNRDLLGTVLLSVLAGHRRYAHITALRCDPVNPPLLGMRKVLSEDAVRRNLGKIDEAPGLSWLQAGLGIRCVGDLARQRDRDPRSVVSSISILIGPPLSGISFVSGNYGEDHEHKGDYPANDSNPRALTLLGCKLDRRLCQLLLPPDLCLPCRLPLLDRQGAGHRLINHPELSRSWDDGHIGSTHRRGGGRPPTRAGVLLRSAR